MSNVYQRETIEFQPVTVQVDGVTVVNNVLFSVVPRGDRPGTFDPPTTLEGRIGVMVDGYDPGTYEVFAQVTSAPEIPVLACGSFRVV